MVDIPGNLDIFFIRSLDCLFQDLIKLVFDINAKTVFSASRPRLLFEGSFRGDRNYDVSPDGKRFLVVQETGQQGTSQTQMHVTLTWVEELRRRVPTK